MRKVGILLMISVLMVLVVACGGGGDDGVVDEVDVTRVSLYTHNTEVEMTDFLKDLKDETGLEVDSLKGSGGVLWSRIESEFPNVQADMQWGSLHSFTLLAEEKDMLHAYKSPEWEAVPDQFKDPDGKWYGWSYWFNVVAVNTDLLEELGLDKPTSWADLLDPQYEGELVITDPGTSTTGYVFVSTIIQLMGEEEGWAYLEALNKNVGQYVQSGSAPAQMVAEGEYAIGISWDGAVFSRIAEGYPMDYVIPEEGVGYDLDCIFIFKGAKNLEGAQKVIDYVGSERGMKAVAEHRSMVTRPGIAGAIDFEPNFIDYDAVWAADNRDRIMEMWRESIQ